MLGVIFIVANVFASLFLFLTMLGSIQANRIKMDIANMLSIIISYVFITICVALSLSHPMLFVFYGVSVAGMLLMFLRPDKEELGLAALTTIAGFLFWPEMIALMIFNNIFTPKTNEETRD
jgi:hypothetical protein